MACRRKAKRKRIQFAQKKNQKTNQPNKQKHKTPYFKSQQITITKTL